MLNDKEWDEFLAWWKEKWPASSPDRMSIQLFLEWQDAKLNNVPWLWKSEKKHAQ